MQTRFVTVGVLVCGGLVGACLFESDPYIDPIGSSSSSSSSSSSGNYGTSSGSYGTTSGYTSSGYTSSGYTSSSSGDEPPPPPECTTDDECIQKHAGDVDAGADRCTGWECTSSKRCRSFAIKGTESCQCNVPEDCDNWNVSFTPKTCNEIQCSDHKCSKTILPAGVAKTEKVGDCAKLSCSGTSEDVVKTIDATDIKDDANPCTVDTCDAATGAVKNTNVTNGTSCGDGAICMEGKCLPCKPANPASCGGEGAGEPANDSSATPSTFAQYTPMCTFSSGSDIDWYTFYAKDADFSTDIFRFKLWSTAPTIELCIYVKCVAGTPGGGCAVKLPGPNGSLGCCWSGAPSTVAPTWDMDCSDTTDDSGTTYVSVRTPGGDSCEQYAISGGY